MVTLRKAGAYSKKYARPYTRISKKRTKNFIKTNPPKKTVKFNMGNIQDFINKKYDTIIRIISKERIQIRDHAIEASRTTMTRSLDKVIPMQYYFEIKIYPHHILRENKMLTGAGSDRMQTGMQRSFGKTMGRAALVKADQTIFMFATTGQKNINIIKERMNVMKSKLPCKTKILIEKIEVPKTTASKK